MNCREILRHLDGCPSCWTEVDTRNRLRSVLRTAFTRAPELQPTGEFADRLRNRLRHTAVKTHRPWTISTPWLALAAALVLTVGATAAILVNRSSASAATLEADAIGDHRYCALKYRLVRWPVPLEEAAQRFDSAYRVLLNAPPDDIPTPDGPAHVLERHSCEYGAHRFGHVIMQYRGRVVSLLMTANDNATAAEPGGVIPRVIGHPIGGLSVVSVNGTGHAVMLVSDLEKNELTQLARMVSIPLAQLAEAATARVNDEGVPQ